MAAFSRMFILQSLEVSLRADWIILFFSDLEE